MAQSDPEDYPIWGYAAWNEFRDPLAAFIGCKRDELALLRNATEANSYIANGVDLKAGDEVLITDQEHPGGEHPWDLRAKRYGIVIKKIALPKPVTGCRNGVESFQRSAYSAHSGDFLQPHYDGDGRGASGEGNLRAGAFERDFVSSGWRARSWNDEAGRT